MSAQSTTQATAKKQERLLLAAILRGTRDGEQKAACEALRPEMFSAWPQVAKAVWEIHESGGIADYETVGSRLEGGLPQPIAQSAPPSKNVQEEYIPSVRMAYIRRTKGPELIDVGKRFLEGEGDLAEIREEAEETVMDLSRAQSRAAVRPASAYTDEVWKEIEASEGEDVLGVPTGLTDYDERLRGYRDGKQYIIAARPHMGKTWLLLNAANHAALNNEKRVAIISIEMMARTLTKRSQFLRAGVPMARRGQTIGYSDQELHDLREAKWDIEDAPLLIADPAAPTPSDVVALMRRIVAEWDVDLIGIDYLQKLQPPSGKERWIGDAAHRLQGEAQSLGVPTILLSQLNRNLEHRSNKRPTMSDLRESGSIEEAADHITFLYRAEHYDISIDEQGNPTDGVAELITAKDRIDGNTGTTEVYFDDETGRFADLDEREPPESVQAQSDTGWSSPGNPNPDDAPF